MLNLFRKRKIIIAIDGYSSCGKSTLARDLAKKLSYKYIDSGAMYRAVTLFLLDNGIDVLDAEAVTSQLDKIHIRFKSKRGRNLCFLNDVDVTDEIRDARISDNVSEVATISAVREKLVALQQSYGLDKGLVMDGRDIGTVVFPDAELKLFVTADIDVRTHRRFSELKNHDMMLSFDQVKDNLRKRDHIDSTRSDSPLLKAEDAITIDNSNLSPQDQLKAAYKLVKMHL